MKPRPNFTAKTRVEMPAGMVLGEGTFAEVDPDRRTAEAKVTITSVERTASGLAVSIDVAVALEAIFGKPKRHRLDGPHTGIQVGFSQPVPEETTP